MGQNSIVPRQAWRTERPAAAPVDAWRRTLSREAGRLRKTTNKHDETTTYALSRGRVAGRRSARRRRPHWLRGQARRTRCAHRRCPRRPCRRSHCPPARGPRTRAPFLRARPRPCVRRTRPRAGRPFRTRIARRGLADHRTTTRVIGSKRGFGARKLRADLCTGRKKARTAGSGLIHLWRRVEETCGSCRSATTNEAYYTNARLTSQENLHYEIEHHNAEFPEIFEPINFFL